MELVLPLCKNGIHFLAFLFACHRAVFTTCATIYIVPICMASKKLPRSHFTCYEKWTSEINQSFHHLRIQTELWNEHKLLQARLAHTCNARRIRSNVLHIEVISCSSVSGNHVLAYSSHSYRRCISGEEKNEIQFRFYDFKRGSIYWYMANKTITNSLQQIIRSAVCVHFDIASHICDVCFCVVFCSPFMHVWY